MLSLSRRGLFLAIPPMVVLTACGTTGTPGLGLSLDQAIADALGIATTLKSELPIIASLFPQTFSTTSMSTVTEWLALAVQSLTGLTSTSPVAITSLATAEQDINLALNVLAVVAQSVSVAYPPAAAVALMVQAAIALAPAIEALLNQLLPAPMTPKARHLAFTPVPAMQLAAKTKPMSAVEARDVLHIRSR
jgi:hypothetical protein